VKRGARGASAYEGGRRVDVSALEVDVKDAVGAGDTFDAGFLHQWVRKAPLETCVAYGNLVGGIRHAPRRHRSFHRFCLPPEFLRAALEAKHSCGVNCDPWVQ
jgi:hypothetical protein